MSLRAYGAVSLATLALACGETDDQVFTALAIARTPELAILEGVGTVDVPLRLTQTPTRRVTAHVRAVADEAQNDCQIPDFEAAERVVEWAPGQLEASVGVYVGDDELAETDERFLLHVEPGEGLPAAAATEVAIVILDDDRSALVDASTRGVTPGSSADRASELQTVLDEAAGLGRAVVTLSPGDYEVSSVRLPPGVTLSARGARWFRPPESAEDVVSLRIEQMGEFEAAPALVEGLAIDGKRDLQGPYRDKERQEAHLVALHGDAERGGRVVAALERLTLGSGTGSGVKIGSDTDVTLCRISANELWRDAITATGGATKIRIRGVDATATEGTGLWVGPREPGFEDSMVTDVEVEDVVIGAGDVEIDSTAGSSVTIRRLTMTRPPFRLDAIDGVVRIADSVLMVGLPGGSHNAFGIPHDVEITGTTLVSSETPYDGEQPDEARTFAAVTVRGESLSPSPPAAGPGRLVFDSCRFELASDVDADDVVYALENPLEDLTVTLRATTLGSGFTDWFAPACTGCSHEP